MYLAASEAAVSVAWCIYSPTPCTLDAALLSTLRNSKKVKYKVVVLKVYGVKKKEKKKGYWWMCF